MGRDDRKGIGEKYQDHIVLTWQQSETEHWRFCVTCGEVDRAKHKINTVTKQCICGYSESTDCVHQWRYPNTGNSTSHPKICAKNCGIERITEPHSYNSNGKCVCGREKVIGQCPPHDPIRQVNNFIIGPETHWYECSRCDYRIDEEPHTFDGDVCFKCLYNKKTGSISLNIDIQINIYQMEYYIDKLLNESTGEYEYKPIVIDLDIIGTPGGMEAISNSLYQGYDYLVGGGNTLFYIKKLNDKQLEGGLTEIGKNSAKYFDDNVTINVFKINNNGARGTSSSAQIRIIKAGEDRARFYATIHYPAKANYNPNESGELIIRARTEYLYANSSEEDVEAFNKLNKEKMGKFIVNKEDIRVKVNNLSKDEAGNVITAINENVQVTSCELKKDQDGNEYYEIRLKIHSEQPGNAKIVTTIVGTYHDKNGVKIDEFEQKREAVASVKVFAPLGTGGSSGGSGSGGSGSNGGGSSTDNGGDNSLQSGGGAGIVFAGAGALGLLLALFMGWKMSQR